MATRGGKRTIKNPAQMLELWNAFKVECDSKTVNKTEFSQKMSKFITEKIPAPVSYTIKSFALFCNMTEENFYLTYDRNDKFKSVIAHMKQECEEDVRRKFENGTINSKLSGLWMSRYGYTTDIKQDVNANVDADINISVDYGE